MAYREGTPVYHESGWSLQADLGSPPHSPTPLQRRDPRILPRITILTNPIDPISLLHEPTVSMSSTEGQLTPTAVSCPAKVFVAGGYLVLDRAHTALVFGLDARIHAIVEPLKTTAGVSISEIVVTSPQFRDAIWEYGYRSHDGGIAVTQLSV